MKPTWPVRSGKHAASRPARESTDLARAEATDVRAWTDTVVLPTYLPAAPDKNPMFLEKRVYQGSSGKVYPLPFTDRIADHPIDRRWKAVWLENEFLKVLVLPEIGGRIHAICDKVTGYDLVYRQEVIKPALVGLAGPWISGGIEFNWPQHHRPATFLPVEVQIERHADGSVTVWCSDHDPLARMKGMHGVCLHPGRAMVELKVRAYNRTRLTQTFLWWANVATRVHEAYQSFFPPDVHYVADHARRSTSAYPLAQGKYYGVDYANRGRKGVPKGERPRQFVPPHSGNLETRRRCPALPDYAPNDLGFYANIPTPCSYMCVESEHDFFGGYDYKAEAGIVHIASHHISPGKKQWTWGNHEFGYAWDRNLTAPDGNGEYAPYIEIMAGVYTDNQPDFSFLLPGETKTWSQFWYPIQKIGPAQQANLEAAVRLDLRRRDFEIGVCVTRRIPKARVRLERADGSGAVEWAVDLVPGNPFVARRRQARKPWKTGKTLLRILDAQRREILRFKPTPPKAGSVPPPATEPPEPGEIPNSDELFITGLHLNQYRHATRCPTLYWREALRRDPGDARCNNALGLWHLGRGEFEEAESCFRKAIARLTMRNANPADGEPLYNLGICLRFLHREKEAYDAFYKATWNQGWAAASCHALAEIAAAQEDWSTALEHLQRGLRLNTDNLRARNLQVLVLRKLGLDREANDALERTRSLDPLDWWARDLASQPLTCDLQTCLDVAHDYAHAGFYAEAAAVLRRCHVHRGPPAMTASLPDQSLGALPIVHYTLGWLEAKRGNPTSARREFRKAAAMRPDYCFPARLEEIEILKSAIAANPGDARAPYYLGNLLYDRRRHDEAMDYWTRSLKVDPSYSVVWRNVGIGLFNTRKLPGKARQAYERAFRAAPSDARLLYERDQLWKRLGESPSKRLRELLKHRALVRQRDDLTVELCSLYNQTDAHEKALRLLSTRKFQPWEGGEGGPLGQHTRAHVGLGREALARSDTVLACAHFEQAMQPPDNLGEAKHLLANQSDAHYWLGMALAQAGDARRAREHWTAAAKYQGDFQEMQVHTFSELTYYSALGWQRLGRREKATKLLTGLLEYARKLSRTEAKIDYFATSLPTMLLFDDDLQFRQETTALLLEAQALIGLGRRRRGLALVRAVLRRDKNHARAADLLEEARSPGFG